MYAGRAIHRPLDNVSKVVQKHCHTIVILGNDPEKYQRYQVIMSDVVEATEGLIEPWRSPSVEDFKPG